MDSTDCRTGAGHCEKDAHLMRNMRSVGERCDTFQSIVDAETLLIPSTRLASPFDSLVNCLGATYQEGACAHCRLASRKIVHVLGKFPWKYGVAGNRRTAMPAFRQRGAGDYPVCWVPIWIRIRPSLIGPITIRLYGPRRRSIMPIISNHRYGGNFVTDNFPVSIEI